jgi:hypothetical protein
MVGPRSDDDRIVSLDDDQIVELESGRFLDSRGVEVDPEAAAGVVVDQDDRYLLDDLPPHWA